MSQTLGKRKYDFTNERNKKIKLVINNYSDPIDLLIESIKKRTHEEIKKSKKEHEIQQIYKDFLEICNKYKDKPEDDPLLLATKNGDPNDIKKIVKAYDMLVLYNL